jgi:hypothetical protein
MTPTTVRDNLKALSSHLLESSGPDFMYESVEQAIVLLGERDLLRRYMQHIVNAESVSYVGEGAESALRNLFSDEEIAVLQEFSREVGAADAPPEPPTKDGMPLPEGPK